MVYQPLKMKLWNLKLNFYQKHLSNKIGNAFFIRFCFSKERVKMPSFQAVPGSLLIHQGSLLSKQTLEKLWSRNNLN